MGQFGPQGDTGSIIPPFQALWYRLTGRGKADVDCQTCEGKGYVLPPSMNQESDCIGLSSAGNEESDSKEEAETSGGENTAL